MLKDHNEASSGNKDWQISSTKAVGGGYFIQPTKI